RDHCGGGVVATTTVPPSAIQRKLSTRTVESKLSSPVSQMAKRMVTVWSPFTGDVVWSHSVPPALFQVLKPVPSISEAPAVHAAESLHTVKRPKFTLTGLFWLSNDTLPFTEP